MNGGHSAYIALTANPDLKFHGVDICQHAYVRPAVAILQELFPGRVSLSSGDCLEVLPRLAQEGLRFDAFHLDGAKHLYFKDILNCSRMIDGGAAKVIVDDTQLRSVAWVWKKSVRYGLIEPQDALPARASAHDRNAAGTLRVVSNRKWLLLSRLHANLPPLISRGRAVWGSESS